MGVTRVFVVVNFVFFCFASVASSFSPEVIDAPSSVGIGQPILVRLAFPFVVDDVEVIWNTQSFHPSIDAAGGFASAAVLLGTPLKSDPARVELVVNVLTDGRTESFFKIIEIVDHPYESEALSVAPRMVAPPKELDERLQRERETASEAISVVSAERRWSVPFSLPVQGKMLSRFGLYRVFNNEVKTRHKGLDFRAYLGSPICSIAPGKVVLVGDDFFYAGNCVYIDHGDGVVSSYAHMSEVLVKEGEQVERGQQIGLSGATGRATGAHLHLSVFAQGVNVDPAPLFSME